LNVLYNSYQIRTKQTLENVQLQCVARCCKVLQGVAECCSVLQCFAVCCSVLQCVAVCCIVFQCVAVCCRLWRTSSCLDKQQTIAGVREFISLHNELYNPHYVTPTLVLCTRWYTTQNVYLPTWQHTATHGNTRQHTATRYNTLQHTATLSLADV